MSETATTERACHTDHHSGGKRAESRHWIGFVGTPSFALMALVTAARGDGLADVLCSSAHGASAFEGMAPMYVLMSAFHSAPWLELISRNPRHAPGN